MYSFSSKIKLTALISMVVGLVAVIYSFIATPSSVADLHQGGEAAHDPAHLEHMLRGLSFLCYQPCRSGWLGTDSL